MGPGPPVLSANGISKRFGKQVALDDVSLEVRAGEVVGLIGPNGAGKTTLLSIIAGVLRSDGGMVEVTGGKVGWVPQGVGLYERLTVKENLQFFARLEHVSGVEEVVAELLVMAGLSDRADDPVAVLSGGNRQRVNIAAGTVGSPALLLLDEPSSALDAVQRKRLWEYVGQIASTGVAVVFSTHVLQEVERFSDRTLILNDGRVVFDGTPAALRAVTEVGSDNDDFESSVLRFLESRE